MGPGTRDTYQPPERTWDQRPPPPQWTDTRLLRAVLKITEYFHSTSFTDKWIKLSKGNSLMTRYCTHAIYPSTSLIHVDLSFQLLHILHLSRKLRIPTRKYIRKKGMQPLVHQQNVHIFFCKLDIFMEALQISSSYNFKLKLISYYNVKISHKMSVLRRGVRYFPAKNSNNKHIRLERRHFNVFYSRLKVDSEDFEILKLFSKSKSSNVLT